MDPIQLFQTTLAGIMSGSQFNQSLPDVASNTTATTNATPLTTPLGLSTLLSFLLSFSAMQDWLKLIIIGGVIETCRRTCLRFWASFVESFWITACFDDRDMSYNWIMFWLSKHPKWSQARFVNISTRSFGLNSPAVAITGDEDDEANGRKLCYLPSFARTYSLWYRGHYLSVTRSQVHEGIYNTKEVLQIDILARDHAVLNNLLLEAKKAYHAAEEHLISIYVSESSGSWRHVASRPKRPLRSIVLDPGMKDLLLEDARDFLQSKEWYSERGIPFRRGYLLYGAPGSGKTSMIHSLAGELGLDVYIISLSRMGLDDTSLSSLISELPEQCIALMEDIDAAFHHGLTRELDDDDEKEEMTDEEHEREKEKTASPSPPLSRITLSGLLNALDGVGAQEGRILYATTNKYKALDSALCRPGRMDLHVEFKLASQYQARELFKCFYLPSDAKEQGGEESESRQTESDEIDHDSAYGSVPSTPPSPTEESACLLEKLEATAQPFVGKKHLSNVHGLSRRRILALADTFADAIPEREFSMASLQGYLMSYKSRPVLAAETAAGWVEKERAEKAAKKSKHRAGAAAAAQAHE